MQVVCTLAHGIWAGKAGWMQPGSLLRRTFGAYLPDVIFEPFPWSGRNGLVSRLHAAKDLRAHLLRMVHQYPSAQHFIIAHSHGGNVALAALCDQEMRDRVSGVVCLSTPFLTADLRRHGKDLILAILVDCCLLIGGVGLYLFLRAELSWWSVALLFVSLFSGVVLIGNYPRVDAWWSRRANTDKEWLQLPPMPRDKLLLVRVAGDEANGLLGFIQLVCWAFDKIWRILERRRARIEAWCKERPILEETTMIISVPFFMFAVPVLVLLILLGIIGFGWRLGMDSPFLRIAAEPVPVGHTQADGYNFRLLPGATDSRGLFEAHAAYLHNEALALICDWIVQRLK